MLIIGIDEAGKGPVIGPLVIGIFGIKENKVDLLNNLENLKDSKVLYKEEREELFDKLKTIADYFNYRIISAREINYYMTKGYKITDLELKYIIEELFKINEPFVLYLDSFINNTNKLKERILKSKITNLVKIYVEFKADQKYKVVSAASIIAKVIRDREINKIKENIGLDFGSGYPSDFRTKEFIERYLKKDPERYKNIVRIKWATVSDLFKKEKQKSLLDFVKK